MLKTPLKFIITIVLTLGLSMSFQSLLASWTAPTASPPNNNVTEPLNTGGVAQTKLGSLDILEDLAVAGVNGLTVLNDVGVGGGLSVGSNVSVSGDLGVSGKISMASTLDSDPVNTVVTKDYVDNKIGSSLEFASGSYMIYGEKGSFTTYNASYTRVFEVRMHKGGDVKVDFSLGRATTGRVYVNNSPVGVERVNSLTYWSAPSIAFSETISNLSEGDRFQIYIRRTSSGNAAVSNIKISVANPDFIQRIVPSTSLSVDGHCTFDSECTWGNSIMEKYDCSGTPGHYCILGHCTNVSDSNCGDDNTDHTPEELQFYREKVRESRDLIEQGKLKKLLN